MLNEWLVSSVQMTPKKLFFRSYRFEWLSSLYGYAQTMSGPNHATTRILNNPKKNYDLSNYYRLSIYLSDKTVSWLVQNKILWIFAHLEMERNAPVFSEIVKSFKPAKKYTSSARINRLPGSLTWFMGRVFPMVVVSRLLHVEVGPNDHRKTHSSLYFYLQF